MFGPARQSTLRILPAEGREPERDENTGEHIFFDASDPASRAQTEALIRARFGLEIGELLSSEPRRESLLARWRRLFAPRRRAG